MRHIALTASFAALALTACAGLPTQQEIAQADYGAFPANYESIVKAHYAMALKDPESVRYAGMTAPKQFWIGDRIDGARYGYLVCATLNAKNSYGGYVGYQTDGLLIRNDTVIMVLDKGVWGGRNLCQ